MKSVSIQFEKVPLYQALAKKLEEKIRNGTYKSGQKLPSYRKLIEEFNVNLSTVTHAVKILEEQQFVILKQGSGVFVTSKLQDTGRKKPLVIEQPRKDAINFAGNNPNKHVYPIENFDEILKQMLLEDREDVFDYQEIEGYLPLRKSISRYAKKHLSIQADYRDIIVVSGSQQGIDLLARSVAGRGDVVFIENPTYMGLKNSFTQTGALVYGINLGKNGIDIDQLERMIKIYKPKVLCVTTTFQTPTTISYEEDVLKRLISLSEKHDFYIIEDDILSEIHFGAQKRLLKSYDRYDRVFYIKSFSKITMPGVRLGFVIVPKRFNELVVHLKRDLDVSLSGLFQRWLNTFLSESIDNHLNRIKQFYYEKYQIAVKHMNELKYYHFDFEEPMGGFNFWLKLPKNLEMKPFYEYCVSKNVFLTPAQSFYSLDGISDHFRLSYVQNDNENLIRGIEILKMAYLKCRL